MNEMLNNAKWMPAAHAEFQSSEKNEFPFLRNTSSDDDDDDKIAHDSMKLFSMNNFFFDSCFGDDTVS
jgi:hypothetical protein